MPRISVDNHTLRNFIVNDYNEHYCHKYTKQELAELLGVSRRTISSMFNNDSDKPISRRLLESYAKLTDRKLNDIYRQAKNTDCYASESVNKADIQSFKRHLIYLTSNYDTDNNKIVLLGLKNNSLPKNNKLLYELLKEFKETNKNKLTLISQVQLESMIEGLNRVITVDGYLNLLEHHFRNDVYEMFCSYYLDGKLYRSISNSYCISIRTVKKNIHDCVCYLAKHSNLN